MAKTVSARAHRTVAKAQKEVEHRDALLGRSAGISPEIEREVGRQLLRYAVSKAIFDPVTGAVLDMRRAVLWQSSTGRSVVMSATLWDERGPAFLAALESEQASGKLPASVTWEVLDGRELWARKVAAR